MKVVATIYTDFSENLESQGKGALAHESEGIIVFEPNTAWKRHCGIEKYSHLCFCGSFQKMYRKMVAYRQTSETGRK